MVKITPDEVNVISRFIGEISGICLDTTKAYLLENRLSSLIDELECSSYSELYYKVKSDNTRTMERKIIDAITTKETLFFRDKYPFDLLQHKILPDLIDNKKAKSSNFFPLDIRIWSAACSTGQEVYSIALTLNDILSNMKEYNIRLLGTDISDEAIIRASYGQYNKFEVERGLSKERLQKYFIAEENSWRVNDEIRAIASFKRHNLMDSLTGLGMWDIIFCRNVAIYFNLEDRKKLFHKIANVLKPDGYLIIGASEYLAGICPRFDSKRYLKSVFYQLRN
ncbi:MAG: protein-glutamate O-methyltransferase CheR [Thermodesulfobacteriota bacterium]|nr:protein-glutamate O-methyltransferase CheR [Thermodesulfobacteriota bacterium]